MESSQLFANRLNAMLGQLQVTGAQLARFLSVDSALVSRWRKRGCGLRSAPQHALVIGRYVASRKLSPENAAWFRNELTAEGLDGALTAENVARWLCPQADIREAPAGGTAFSNLLVVDSFIKSACAKDTAAREPDSAQALHHAYDVCAGADDISSAIGAIISGAENQSELCVYLSSEMMDSAVDPAIAGAVCHTANERELTVRMLVQSANNSQRLSRLIGTYMPLMVLGRLKLSLVQGTPQTFTCTMNLLLPEQAALIITETVQKSSSAVAMLVRDRAMLRDMAVNFADTARYARPLMTAYDDSFARSIIETYFEEYGVPGNLDVIKCGLNPMFLATERYGDILAKYGHTGEQYRWRYEEYSRFKAAMDNVLTASRFREVLSLNKLREIARTGRCRMPSMYFMEAGVWELDAADCVALLDGYIAYLERVPNFEVILLDDETVFMNNTCWHIKNNKHIIIHTWNIDAPIMVYSDQLLLIDEFQKHFDHLWNEANPLGVDRRRAVETLRRLRDECAEHS